MATTLGAKEERGQRPFRFENAWLEEEDLPVVVGESWLRNSEGDFMRKMEDCSHAIDTWGRKPRSRYKLEINKCKAGLELLCDSTDSEAKARYKEVNGRLSSLLTQEEAFWRQQAKVHWLRDGDTNSKFFHARASARRRRNAILSLQRDDGSVVSSQGEMGSVAHTYFTSLLRGSRDIINRFLIV